MALTDFLDNIADAIRAKDGTEAPIVASTFAQRILDIPSDGGETLPENIRIETFELIGDATELVVPHGLDTIPSMYFVSLLNPSNIIGKTGYSFVSFQKSNGYTMLTDYSKNLTYKNAIFSASCDNQNITISSANSSYKIRGGEYLILSII